MSNEQPTADQEVTRVMPEDIARGKPPSYFASLGNPNCSRWGKSEIEWMALAYVQALASNGDKWDRLTRDQVLALLSDEQRQRTYQMLNTDYYQGWFDMVSEQINSWEGALGVGGFWRRWP